MTAVIRRAGERNDIDTYAVVAPLQGAYNSINPLSTSLWIPPQPSTVEMLLSNLLLIFSTTLSITHAAPTPSDPIELAVFAAPAATTPPKGAATIQSVAVDTSGSGCRAGTVGVAISTDNSIMTFVFDDFQAAIGPTAGDTSKRALCKVNVTMSSPGWAFDVQTVDFRGYVKLGKGVDVSLVSRWKWVDQKTNVDLKGKVS